MATKRDYNKEFIGIVQNLNWVGLPDSVDAAASHPLMQTATHSALFEALDTPKEQDEYQQMLEAVAWEFCLGPDELCKAMELSQERVLNGQA